MLRTRAGFSIRRGMQGKLQWRGSGAYTHGPSLRWMERKDPRMRQLAHWTVMSVIVLVVLCVVGAILDAVKRQQTPVAGTITPVPSPAVTAGPVATVRAPAVTPVPAPTATAGLSVTTGA